MTPINDAALAIGAPRLEYVRQGGHGTVTVTMPDGEVLTGTYSIASNASAATTLATTSGPRGPVVGTATTYADGGPSNLWVSATGAHTHLTCQGQVGGSHGGGICQTNGGAQYQLMF